MPIGYVSKFENLHIADASMRRVGKGGCEAILVGTLGGLLPSYSLIGCLLVCH